MTTTPRNSVDLPGQARLIAERLRDNGFPAEGAVFVCPAPHMCPCHNDADEHAVYAWHCGHDGTGRDDCPYCPTKADIAEWEAEQQAAQEGGAA